ncbi:tigger transposable element-derived protein 6-like [Rhizophagus irregularis DAOM 181602=DAOM 197198]|nr:tigger transposable element-derived protein 6-like [Rhizophagus irregularis DAOM 181602=DAOM 197198]
MHADHLQIRLQNYNILLLVDNASIHIINENVNLTNIVVHFLPPNTTSYLQLCDAEGPHLLLIKVFRKNFKFTSNFTSDPIG